MISKETVLLSIGDAIDRINGHLAGDLDASSTSISPTQLKRILAHLVEMKNCIEDNNLQNGKRLIGIGRVIVDSWPYDSVIGNLILKADQDFKTYIQ